MALNIDHYFESRIDQFHKNIITRIHRTNPFRSLVPMRKMDLAEGLTPTIITNTHEFPTAYPTALTAVAFSTGTGDTACDPARTTIKRGSVQRTFSLEGVSFDTDDFCVSDIKRSHQAARAASDFEKGLGEYVQVFWSDYARVQNIGMVDFKYSTTGAASVEETESTKADFTDITTLPTFELNWDHLRHLYWDLVRRGAAQELAIGMAGGQPVFPLIAGVGILDRLFLDDDIVRKEVRFFDPKSNLKPLGYASNAMSVSGFLPIADVFPVRYGKTGGIATPADLVAANMIYPTTNAAATKGQKHIPNVNYPVSDNGGLAEYEVVTILPKEIYELRYEAANPTVFSKMDFKPVDYLGEFSWVNNKTFRGDNDRGNIGYYLADIRVGPASLNPDYAKTIVTLAVDS